ncbi:MAG: peptidoglycan DD-metalloendopeptidase family protein [Bdellovibrionota bacterium]
MSTNRFYTVMIVPEKTSQVRRIIIPAWLARGAAIVLAFAMLIAIVMVFDYWYVMSQIGENKQLKMENRRLRQEVQVFKNKMTTVENTMDRVKTFAARLRVITNIEDRGNLLQSLNTKLPNASSNVGTTAALNQAVLGVKGTATDATLSSLVAASTPIVDPESMKDPEDAQLRREYEALDGRFSELNRDTLMVEQTLQDEYELLADQKSFLAALPTRKPAIGYYTSGFGVRTPPVGGGRVRMHEGLDIAARIGTPISATADGVVAFADSKAGYGQTVILDHGYGLETWYGHTKKILVTKGQKIHRGERIALLGNSGRSTGPHVHYEVRVHNIPVDPWTFILSEN